MQYVLKVNIQNQNLKPLSAFCVAFSLVLSRLLTQTQFSCDVALGKPLFGSRPGTVYGMAKYCQEIMIFFKTKLSG